MCVPRLYTGLKLATHAAVAPRSSTIMVVFPVSSPRRGSSPKTRSVSSPVPDNWLQHRSEGCGGLFGTHTDSHPIPGDYFTHGARATRTRVVRVARPRRGTLRASGNLRRNVLQPRIRRVHPLHCSKHFYCLRRHPQQLLCCQPLGSLDSIWLLVPRAYLGITHPPSSRFFTRRH